MTTARRLTFSFFALTIVVALVGSAHADDPARDGGWLAWSHMAGTEESIFAIQEIGDLVVVGGSFTEIGGVVSPGVAAWNRATGEWSGFGPGLSATFGPYVRALAMHNNLLYAAGWFACSGSTTLQNVAVWDDGQWQPVGGIAPGVSHLASFAGELYAVAVGGGNLLRWTGSEWVLLFSTAGNVTRVLVADDLLLLAGDFVSAGGQDVDRIVGWDGENIVVAYQGLPATVRDLALYQDKPVASGWFPLPSGAAGVARWDGAQWIRVGDLEYWDNEYVHVAARGDELYVNLKHQYWDGPAGQYILKWNGSAWEQFGTDVWAASLHCLHVDDWGGLWIGGDFRGIGPVAGRNIQHHDGSGWVELFPAALACDGPVLDLAVHDNRLIAAGNFFAAGSVYSPQAAAWDGTSWSPRGARESGQYEILDMRAAIERLGLHDTALLAAGDDYGGWGGEFRAQWYPGAGWHTFDLDDIADWVSWNGWLVEGEVVGNVRRRQNAESPPTVLGHIDGSLYDLAVWQGQLVAVGGFYAVNDVDIDNVAIFDGTTWSAAGQGANSSVESAIAYDDDLVVAGSFTTMDGSSMRRIARWDGAQWSPLGTGLNGAVSDLAVYRDYLVAVGWFTEAGGVEAARVALWDGQQWWPLDGGVDDYVNAVAVYDGDLYLGGGFHSAGGLASAYIARWHYDPLTAAPTSARPSATGILAAAPNPCNPRTTITFTLAQPGPATLQIYDLRGRLVRTVSESPRDAGQHAATWDGSDDLGAPAASGVYLLKLITAEGSDTHKLVLAQ